MDGVYLYCITHAGSTPHDRLTGIGEKPVTAVLAGDLAAWVEPLERAPAATLESIRHHHHVIAAALASGSPAVPVRFGQWLNSEEELVERMMVRAEEYGELLEQFRGAVEMGLRVVAAEQLENDSTEKSEHGTSGREYMQALAREQSRRREWSALGEEIAAELRAAGGRLVQRERTDPLSAPELVSVAHLVREADVAAYEAAVDRVRGLHPELNFLSSGPWPPYSFAT
jgi:hypothetical protein